jgi:hypothetical protein
VPFRFIQKRKGGLVLLFYDGFEWRAREGPLARTRSLARRFGRYVYRSLRWTQVFTGYYPSFRPLRMGLEGLGYDVRVNDFRTARAHPNYPTG